MTAKILDGNALSAKLRESLRHRAAELAAQGFKPGLAVILVGENPASQVYVRNKIKACEAVGVHSEKYEFPADTPPQKVLNKIAALNADPKIHGILVQLPLPPQFDEDEVLEAVSAEKDVDGFHAENVGLLAQGNPRFISCTPYGVMEMLSAEGISLRGKEAVVVGRSNIVGKPMTLLLIGASATVTVCHSQTRDLAFHTRRADVLVAAVGKPKMITGDMIKPGAVVIDV
ncbi:MAG: bifunctional methylenetetrahydrofolate dehydrogenase/methenyltetrahydrofolate cyclohydrolase, partial [Rhodocyclaceae bacterium]|nr:bifunctional methylenetetrahydrofolate dehydrogenase/methenyltetrahydrofolate cyclohydrolase [Rhodocyclaceae bacterium]